jgi:phospholipid/cholesterol/gamma-HCH transport system permease protein
MKSSPQAIAESINQEAKLIQHKDAHTLACLGDWTRNNINSLECEMASLEPMVKNAKTIDASSIRKLDTVGAWFLYRLIQQYNPHIEVKNLGTRQRVLFKIIAKYASSIQKTKLSKTKLGNLALIGKLTLQKYYDALSFFAFVGELFTNLVSTLKRVKTFQWKSTFHIVQETGYFGTPIVALMSFLIGIVLAYQLSIQLEIYGANIFIVDITGIAILREFGPLITAIIMAGRTSTAFTALIGTMKVNEEIDALSTYGIHPLECLVLPRVWGLLIVLPLLTVWSDVWGIFGSMVMSKAKLHISYASFLIRFSENVYLRHYILGLIKTPIFALIITLVGCFQGFQVTYNAESVGERTTKSAVQSIFLIIIADGVFSIIFSWYGL